MHNVHERILARAVLSKTCSIDTLLLAVVFPSVVSGSGAPSPSRSESPVEFSIFAFSLLSSWCNAHLFTKFFATWPRRGWFVSSCRLGAVRLLASFV